jgi:hypothetical protein
MSHDPKIVLMGQSNDSFGRGKKKKKKLMWAHLSPINKSMKIGRHLSSFLSKRANRKGIYKSLIPTLEWPIMRVILITKRIFILF